MRIRKGATGCLLKYVRAPAAPGGKRISFDGASLGVGFDASGVVKGCKPGGEAEQKGVTVGDRIVAVGAAAVGDDQAIRAAVAAHPQRPVVLTFEPAARAPRRVVFAGPTLGIAFEPTGVVKGVQPGGEAQQKRARAGDRVVKVGAAAVTTDASIRAAVVAHPARPIELTLA